MNAVSGSTPIPLLHTNQNSCPSFSQSGVIAFQSSNQAINFIDTVLPDGSQQKQVATENLAIFPTISPNGATIAYADIFGEIWTMPSGGGTPTEIYSASNAYAGPVAWSPSSTQIAFSAKSGTYNQVYTMSSTGTGTKNVTPNDFVGGHLLVNSWSPDGNSLACEYIAGGAGNAQTVVMAATGNAFDSILTPSGYNDEFPTFSPDSGEIAFYRTNAGGASPGLYISNVFGTTPQLVLSDPTTIGTTGPVIALAWSPFQGGETFVGSHGTITSSPVAGFLVTEAGSAFASLLTFTATTPSTATLVQSGTNTSGAPMAYTLGADSVTNISFTNVYTGAHSSIPLTSTPNAIVTIDAGTGFVNYVVPALTGKAHPMVSRSSGTALTYTGSFAAIYDGTGKNLAPGGAATIEIDRTTGKLVSFK